MCGICGQLNFHAGDSVDETLLDRMTWSMRHRGPDDRGLHVDGNVGLGMQRLSVIDIAGSHQPISNEDDTCWIVFNGELYNYQDLRRELQSKGFAFKTSGDAEVVLHAYEEYGPDCLQRFRGMFAFGIADARQNQGGSYRLFLARDRFGVKPLYYRQSGRGLAFASELKALTQDPTLKRNIDAQALHHYLGLMYVPSPHTLFAEIRRLPSGHWMMVNDGKVEMHQYWSLRRRDLGRIREEDALEELKRLATEAVRLRMISDVPLGVFLSGGVDSSLITGVMAQASSEPVRSFSAGFPIAAYDERGWARQVSERFGTQHHEFELQPTGVDVLPEVVRHMDDPLGDPSAIPLYHISQMAREEVTVVLAGEGGDELFGGYGRYMWDRYAEMYQRLPGLLRRGVMEPIASRMPRGDAIGWKSYFRRAAKFIETSSQPFVDRYLSWMAVLPEEMREDLYADEWRGQAAVLPTSSLFEERLVGGGPGLTNMQAMQYIDMSTLLTDDLLLKADKMSMAHSLELRVPLLDHELAEFVFSLPDSLKVRGNDTKYLLKRWLEEMLPKEIVHRKKQGFEVPLPQWFREDLWDYAVSMLSDSKSTQRGIFKPEAVKRLLDDHMSRRREHSAQIYTLLMLELWFREFADIGQGQVA